MRAIALSGRSRSGKTTSCEILIRRLCAMGYRVGSVKEIHSERFRADSRPEANTGRHRAAGAGPVIARGLTETAFYYSGKLPITDILRQFHSHDFVILEGVNDGCVPRIVTGKDESELLAKLDERSIAVAGVFANTHSGLWNGLPILNAVDDPVGFADFVLTHAAEPLPGLSREECGLCGSDCASLAADLAHGRAEKNACPLLSCRTELSLGGEELPLSPALRDGLLDTLAPLLRGRNGELLLRVRL